MPEQELTIAIDARWIFEALSGVGVYTRNLIRHIPLVDDRNRYVLLFDSPALMERERQRTEAAKRRNVSVEVLPYSVFSLRNQAKLPRKLKQLGVDVYHSPNFMIPLRNVQPKTFVTIHDLIPLLFPQYTRRSKKSRLFPLYRWLMKRVAGKADAIIADSDCTRNDILNAFHVPADKVHRIHLGVDEVFSPGPATGVIRRKFGISGKLILCVGRQDPYKNVLAAVKAFRLVLEKKRELNCHMLIVGEKDPRYPEVAEYVQAENLSGRVIMTDYLEDEDLVAAYRDADVLVHLSLYEGFGLPPLEALSCGIPVVSSDRASLPEVLGNSALYADPHDPSEAAAKIIELLTNEELRSRLASRGRQWVAKYRWDQTAKEVIELYRKTAAGARGEGARQ
jgi:glycosyltransferase involved in cell wall biosynthesis